MLAIFRAKPLRVARVVSSKQVDGKVVPTWNYVVVHARTKIRHEPERSTLVTTLTDRHETPRPERWRGPTPPDYVAAMLRAIGFEIRSPA